MNSYYFGEVSDRTILVSDRLDKLSDRTFLNSPCLGEVSDRLDKVSDRLDEVSDRTI